MDKKDELKLHQDKLSILIEDWSKITEGKIKSNQMAKWSYVFIPIIATIITWQNGFTLGSTSVLAMLIISSLTIQALLADNNETIKLVKTLLIKIGELFGISNMR